MSAEVIPFWWRDHFDNSHLHSIVVDSGDKLFKVTELIHRLEKLVMTNQLEDTGLNTGTFPLS